LTDDKMLDDLRFGQIHDSIRTRHLATSNRSSQFGRPDVPWAAPVFRWAGSKRKLLPVLVANTPSNYRRYFEPFAGSACLFFALRPNAATLGDVNSELLNTYLTICRHPRLVHRAASSLSTSKRAYYQIRSWDPEFLPDVERAARFVYLNRYCFNGVYRINRNGQFNVPRGIRTGQLPDEASFYRCSVALRHAALKCGDFEDAIAGVKRNDFVYLDPPYASTGRPRFGEYGYECFADSDVPRLIKCLESIDATGATFLLSYSDSPALAAPLKRWNSIQLNVRRHIAGFAGDRKVVSEVMVSNQKLRRSTHE